MTTAERLVRRALLIAATSTFAACGGGGEGPAGNNNTNTGTMSATVDGGAWSTNAANATANAGGIFTLTGVEPASGIGVTMTLYHIGTTGTYPLGVGNTVAGGLASVVLSSTGWSTPLSGNAGTVTITAVSPTRITGTFSFTAPRVTGTGGSATRTVTQGQFDLPVNGPATLVVPDNAASRMEWAVGGVAHTASTIASVAAPTAGVLTFAGSNISQTVNIIVSEYTGVGTYVLGSGAARHVRLTSNVTPTGTWGGTNATTTGSLTVTSATATRLIGSVSVRLQPIAGTTGGAVNLFATFNIGI